MGWCKVVCDKDQEFEREVVVVCLLKLRLTLNEGLLNKVELKSRAKLIHSITSEGFTHG